VSNSARKFSFIKKGTSKSPSIKKIEHVVWETLSKAQFVNEKLAWGDNDGDSEDEMFYTPLGSPKKECTSFTMMPCPKTHLQVDTYLHFAIVKQFTKLIVILNSKNSKFENLANAKLASK
jgi:hypothetical protein